MMEANEGGGGNLGGVAEEGRPSVLLKRSGNSREPEKKLGGEEKLAYVEEERKWLAARGDLRRLELGAEA